MSCRRPSLDVGEVSIVTGSRRRSIHPVAASGGKRELGLLALEVLICLGSKKSTIYAYILCEHPLREYLLYCVYYDL